MDRKIVHSNVTIGENGHLYFAGADTTLLAEKYGTPVFLLDDARVRTRVREYKEAMARNFGEASMPLFASKALSFKEIYRIMAQEGIGTDIVSSGELFTAVCAGFPMERAFFHGNNKTDFDIEYAIEHRIGYFIVDSMEELDRIDEYAEKARIRQKILLRLTPGIDPAIFDLLVQAKYKGVLIEAFGAGGLHYVNRDLYGKLELLRQAAVRNGWDVILGMAPEEPGRTEHLLIPELGLAFVSTRAGMEYGKKPWRRMRVDALAQPEGKSRLRFQQRMASLLREDAVSALKEAKRFHDKLEDVYNPYVDFDGVRALAALETGRLLSYLK